MKSKRNVSKTNHKPSHRRVTQQYQLRMSHQSIAKHAPYHGFILSVSSWESVEQAPIPRSPGKELEPACLCPGNRFLTCSFFFPYYTQNTFWREERLLFPRKMPLVPLAVHCSLNWVSTLLNLTQNSCIRSSRPIYITPLSLVPLVSIMESLCFMKAELLHAKSGLLQYKQKLEKMQKPC